MQAYGLRKHDELEYADMGAPSKHRKMTSKHRKSARRALHKQGRRDGKKGLVRTA